LHAFSHYRFIFIILVVVDSKTGTACEGNTWRKIKLRWCGKRVDDDWNASFLPNESWGWYLPHPLGSKEVMRPPPKFFFFF
jgi:hypothetical protein